MARDDVLSVTEQADDIEVAVRLEVDPLQIAGQLDDLIFASAGKQLVRTGER